MKKETEVLTVAKLMKICKKANPNSVVTLLHYGIPYSDFDALVIDDTKQGKPGEEIGNLLLKLHPESDAAIILDDGAF